MSKNTKSSPSKDKKSLLARFSEWKNRPREKMPTRRKVFLAIAAAFGLLAFTEVLGTDEKGWWFLCFTVAIAFFLLWFDSEEEKKKEKNAPKANTKAKASSAAASTGQAARPKAGSSTTGSSKASRKKFKR